MESLLSWVLWPLNQWSPKSRRWKSTFGEWTLRCNSKIATPTPTSWLYTCAFWLLGSEHRSQSLQVVPQPFWLLSPAGTTAKASLGQSAFHRASCVWMTADLILWGKSDDIAHCHASFAVKWVHDSEAMLLCKHHTVMRTFSTSVDGHTVGNTVDRKGTWVPWIDFNSEPVIPSRSVSFPYRSWQSSY